MRVMERRSDDEHVYEIVKLGESWFGAGIWLTCERLVSMMKCGALGICDKDSLLRVARAC